MNVPKEANEDPYPQIAEGIDSRVYRLGTDWVLKQYKNPKVTYQKLQQYAEVTNRAYERVPSMKKESGGTIRIGNLRFPYLAEVNPVIAIGMGDERPFSVSPFIAGLNAGMLFRPQQRDLEDQEKLTDGLFPFEREIYQQIFNEESRWVTNNIPDQFTPFSSSWQYSKLGDEIRKTVECGGIDIFQTNVKLRVHPDSKTLRLIITDLCFEVSRLSPWSQ